MEQTVLISMPVSDLQALIMDCVSTCLSVSPTSIITEGNNEKPLTVFGAADHIDLDEQTVYRLVREKKIPHHKQGKKLYFYVSELNEWIRSGKGKTLQELAAQAEAELLEANKKRRG